MRVGLPQVGRTIIFVKAGLSDERTTEVKYPAAAADERRGQNVGELDRECHADKRGDSDAGHTASGSKSFAQVIRWITAKLTTLATHYPR